MSSIFPSPSHSGSHGLKGGRRGGSPTQWFFFNSISLAIGFVQTVSLYEAGSSSSGPYMNQRAIAAIPMNSDIRTWVQHSIPRKAIMNGGIIVIIEIMAVRRRGIPRV